MLLLHFLHFLLLISIGKLENELEMYRICCCRSICSPVAKKTEYSSAQLRSWRYLNSFMHSYAAWAGNYVCWRDVGCAENVSRPDGDSVEHCCEMPGVASVRNVTGDCTECGKTVRLSLTSVVYR